MPKVPRSNTKAEPTVPARIHLSTLLNIKRVQTVYREQGKGHISGVDMIGKAIEEFIENVKRDSEIPAAS
jgi:hypothetical protein